MEGLCQIGEVVLRESWDWSLLSVVPMEELGRVIDVAVVAGVQPGRILLQP